MTNGSAEVPPEENLLRFHLSVSRLEGSWRTGHQPVSPLFPGEQACNYLKLCEKCVKTHWLQIRRDKG